MSKDWEEKAIIQDLRQAQRHSEQIASSVLQSVRNIQPYANTPNASVYIHKILHTIRSFEEKSPDDVILEVLFAFYDALAYQNQWTAYTSAQFENAEEILSRVTKGSIKSKDIEKAIAALDNIGFDTIPFQFSLEDDDVDTTSERTTCADCGADIPNDGNCWYCENMPSRSSA